MKPSPTDAFNDLLEGRSDDASSQVKALAKLALAMAPAERTSADPRFRARLRNELLAAASAVEEDEAERFAMALDHGTADAEVRELVAVAAALEPSSRPLPSPAFRYGLRNRLAGSPARGGRVAAAVASANARMRRSLRSVLATGVVATMLAGSGGAFAAAHSALPTDDLYPLKRFREAAALSIRSGPAKGFVYLDHARTRLEEIRGMTRRAERDPKPYVETLDDMDEQTIAGGTLILDAFKAKAVSAEAVRRVGSFARVQVADLSILLDRVPEGAKPRARDSLIVAARVVHRAGEVLKGCPCPSNALEQPPATPGQQGPVGCACTPTPRSGSDGDGSTGGSNTPPNGGTTPPDDPQDPEDPNDPSPTDEVPNVPGTTTDEELKELIDELINELPPAPEPSLEPTIEPTIPLTLPGVPSTGL